LERLRIIESLLSAGNTLAEIGFERFGKGWGHHLAVFGELSFVREEGLEVLDNVGDVLGGEVGLEGVEGWE
jgi:hypothetical protein